MRPCRKCGAKVEWRKTDGKWNCYNPDGSDHWDSCSKNVWDDVKKHGEKFTRQDGRETVTGFRSEKYGEKAAMRSGIVIKGKKYKPVTHVETCHVLPWENCGCGSSL